MEFAACLVPLYVMHRILPFACATCIAVACYVAARRYASRPMHSRVSFLLHKLVRCLRAHCENESFSPEELCPVASIYQNAEPHTLLLTPELHTEVGGIVGSIMQGFIQPWYEPISSVQEFPRHVEGILEDTLLELSHKLAFIHPAKALQLSLETLCSHLQKLPRCRESSPAGQPDHPAGQPDHPAGQPDHPAVAADRHTEWLYLESLTTVALRLVEPGDILGSKATHMLILQLICRDVLLPLVDRISRPRVIFYLVVLLCTPASAELDELLDASSSSETGSSLVAARVDRDDNGSQEPSVNELLDALVMPKKSALARIVRQSPKKVRRSVDIEPAVEADYFSEQSLPNKVSIIKTESRSEHGKGVYTVYCIEYHPPFEDIVYRSKRRFNEFLNLQAALSKQGKLDSVLRGIKSPSRWLANPFINDKKNVMNRMIYLQNYLRQLASVSEITRTPHFQTFVGICGDPNTFFTGGVNSNSHNPLRIDRMLADGVRGAFDLFKTALPTESAKDVTDRGSTAVTPPPSWLEGSNSIHANLEFKYELETGSRKLRQDIFNYIDNFDLASSPEFSPVHSQTPLTSTKPESDELRACVDVDNVRLASFDCPATLLSSSSSSSPLSPLSPLSPSSSSPSAGATLTAGRNSQEATPSSTPLTRAILDVVTVVLESHRSSRLSGLLTSLESILGPFTEEWLSEKLEEFISPHNCATALHRLHLLISGLAQGDQVAPSERSMEEAHEALRSLLPSWVQNYLPADEFIYTVLESVQDERFNRALVYKLSDAILDLVASVGNTSFSWTG